MPPGVTSAPTAIQGSIARFDDRSIDASRFDRTDRSRCAGSISIATSVERAIDVAIASSVAFGRSPRRAGVESIDGRRAFDAARATPRDARSIRSVVASSSRRRRRASRRRVVASSRRRARAHRVQKSIQSITDRWFARSFENARARAASDVDSMDDDGDAARAARGRKRRRDAYVEAVGVRDGRLAKRDARRDEREREREEANDSETPTTSTSTMTGRLASWDAEMTTEEATDDEVLDASSPARDGGEPASTGRGGGGRRGARHAHRASSSSSSTMTIDAMRAIAGVGVGVAFPFPFPSDAARAPFPLDPNAR